MHLFYIEHINENSSEITLNEEESKHACRVLRLKNLDKISLLNGRGYSFLAEIIDSNPKKCLVKILSFEKQEEDLNQIHIAIAPTKNMDRLEWFVEKATEIGVTEISLFFSKNSERKTIKIERIEKILISAMKQSQRKYLPKLSVYSSLNDFFKKNNRGAIAHCNEGIKSNINHTFQKTNYPILIGPEGDFSPEEIQKAKELAFDAISLGENRLRTETAGLYACVLAKSLSEI